MKHRRAQVPVRLVLIPLVVGVVGLGVLVALRLSRPMVTVTDVVEGPVVEAFYATGTVSPVREYPIHSNIAGVLTEVKVDKGDHVTQGQPLAVVTDPELSLQADKARSDLQKKKDLAAEKTSPVARAFDARIQSTEAMLATARREEKRYANLIERNSASYTDYEAAQDHVHMLWSQLESTKADRATKLRELQSDVEVAEAALKIALWNLEQQTLRSPIDGVVLDRPASLGTRLIVNGHVMQVADVRTEKLVMRAAVDEENIARVNEGQLVRMTLYAFPARAFDGTVKRIYDKADPERRTFEVDVALSAPDAKLAAGMTGELAFVVAEKERSLVAPAQALQGGKVYAIRSGKLTRVDAKIGLKSIERIELLSGLDLGDKVLISPVGSLSEGQSVRQNWVDPVTAAGLNKPKEAEIFKGFH